MRYIKRFSFLLLLPLLFSCSSEKASSSAKYYIERNGDLLSVPSSETYEGVGPESDSASLIKEAKAGIVKYLLVSSSECSHCENFRPIFIESILKENREISCLHCTEETSSSYWDEIENYQEEYGSDRDSGGIDGTVPSLYRFDKEGCHLLNMYADTGTSIRFNSYLGTECALSNVYRFRDYYSFEKINGGNPSALVFLFNSLDEDALDFYSSSLYSKAIKSEKKLFILDYAAMDEETKAEALSYFSLESYSPVISCGSSSYDIIKEKSEAEALALSYYSED